MLIVGCIAWPHESYLRYPAHPGFVQESYADAATTIIKRKRQVGAGHYTKAIGAIKYTRELAEQAKKVTTLLYAGYKDGFLFPGLGSCTLDYPQPTSNATTDGT